MGLYKLATNGRVYDQAEAMPAGVTAVALLTVYDTQGATSPTAPENPAPSSDDLLLSTEMAPASGNTRWVGQNAATTVTASSAGWRFVSSDPARSPRISVSREPFTVGSGTVTFRATPASTSTGQLTAGIDWFSDGPTYVSSAVGVEGSGVVTAARPSGVTQAKPWVRGNIQSATITAAKMTLLAGAEPPPSPDPGTPTPPTRTLQAGGSIYTHYDEVWGNSILTQPIPDNFPVENPNDKFAKGREIMRQSIPSNGFYAPTINIKEYSLPVYVVDSRLPAYPKTVVRHRNRRGFGSVDTWGNDLKPYMARVPMKGTEKQSEGTDGSITFYDVATGEMFDLWQYDPSNKSAEWCGYSRHVPSNFAACHDVGTVVASGLHGAGIQIGIDELLAGEIKHAVGLEMPKCGGQWNKFSWPAKYSDGHNQSAAPLQGQFLVLDRSYDVNTLPTRFLRILARAAQVYGLVPTDTSGCVAVRGEPPHGWMAQNNTSTDPWPGILEGRANWQSLNGFPWDRLIALPPNYRKP